LTFEYELFATTENKLILNVDKEKLKAAPGFDPDAKRLDFADLGIGERPSKLSGIMAFEHVPSVRRGRKAADL
jgi:hypothetical protein